MSKISLKHSGGNVVSLNSPTSAPTSADVAFKLPNQDGSASEALITDGSGNLSFAGTGKILQVVQTFKTDITSGSGSQGTFQDISGLSVSITPTSSSNKILITFSVQFGAGSTGTPVGIRLERGGTGIGIADASSTRNRCTVAEQTTYSNANNTVRLATSQFLDSPNTTSSVTYNLAIVSSASWYINRSEEFSDGTNHSVGTSFITAMEVAA